MNAVLLVDKESNQHYNIIKNVLREQHRRTLNIIFVLEQECAQASSTLVRGFRSGSLIIIIANCVKLNDVVFGFT